MFKLKLTYQNSWDNDELLELLAKLVAIGKLDSRSPSPISLTCRT
jgi:hypothetical protein